MVEENTNLTPTPASEWKGKVIVEGTAITLPSGNVCLIQPISPVAFMNNGIIPDPLRPTVQKMIESKQGMRPKDQKKILADKKMLASAMEMMDRTICHVIIEPVVVMPPTCKECDGYKHLGVHDEEQPSFKHKFDPEKRDPAVLYADQVDMVDKEFVFNVALGGTKRHDQFREEREASLGSVPDGGEVPVQGK